MTASERWVKGILLAIILPLVIVLMDWLLGDFEFVRSYYIYGVGILIGWLAGSAAERKAMANLPITETRV